MKHYFRIRDQLLTSPEERAKHIEALNKVRNNPIHSHHFDFLYENLNILDSKTATLLAFNSIILAVVAIFQSGSQILAYTIIYSLCIIILLVSCILCLQIVWIHWSTTEDLQNVESHCNNLFKVRYKRTIKYRIAWWLALSSLTAFLIVRVIEIILKAISASIE